MRGGIGRTLAVVGVGFLLLVGLLLAALPSRSDDRSGSVVSTENGGLRALFLLLEALGQRTLAWTRAPGELPRSADLLFLPAIPEEPAGYSARAGEGTSEAGKPTSVRRQRDLRHYRRFVDEGGTLVLALSDPGGKELAFLRDTLEIGELAGLELGRREAVESVGSLRAVLRSGERLKLSRTGDVRLAGTLPERAEVLAEAEDGATLAFRLAVGRGAILVLAVSPLLFINNCIADEENALFFVRLLEDLPAFERILFDEYALGGWAPVSPLALAFGPGALLLSAHALALLVLLLWRSAWSWSFARDPEPLASVSALARAQGFAGAIARARRWDLLARLLCTGTLERWRVRAGLRQAGVNSARASVQDGARLEPAAVEATLAALFRSDAETLARARTTFLEQTVRSEEQLARLDAELRGLERALFARVPRGALRERAPQESVA